MTGIPGNGGTLGEITPCLGDPAGISLKANVRAAAGIGCDQELGVSV